MRQIILSAVFALSVGAVGAADLYKPVTPQSLKGVANTRIGPKHAYEARPARPLPGRKTIEIDGVVWQCAGDSCEGEGDSPAPDDADCDKLAKQIGKLAYCGKKGGYRPPLTAGPALKDAESMKKPIKPTQTLKPRLLKLKPGGNSETSDPLTGGPTLKGAESLKKPVKPTQSLQPEFLKLRPGGDSETSDSPSRPAIRIPHTVTTRPLEIIGSSNPPRAVAEFSPLTVTTRALEIIGSPDLPREARPFKPITVTTTPLEVIGTPVTRGD